jgi:hypothetical protein
MTYFFNGDHLALAGNHAVNAGQELPVTSNKFMDLHSALYPRMRNHGLDLHPRWQKKSIVSNESAASLAQAQSVVLTYFRPQEQADMVERLMGKDNVSHGTQVDAYRHPVIELRLTPEHFAIELIVSPYAWWDQQNFVGKMQLPGQRNAFRTVLSSLDNDYRLGFWDGIHLSDMHLTNAELLRGRILDEWMDTFAEGQDWLRIGKWYTPEDEALDSRFVVGEVFNAIKSLHNVYAYMLWTSNNNFHNFYEKRQQLQNRRAYV